jgi:hypothetical protein
MFIDYETEKVAKVYKGRRAIERQTFYNIENTSMVTA